MSAVSQHTRPAANDANGIDYLGELAKLDRDLALMLKRRAQGAGQPPEALNRQWRRLWDDYKAEDERRFVYVVRNGAKRVDGVDPDDREYKVKGFAKAALTVAPEKWDRLPETLREYPIDIWPYVKNTVQEHEQLSRWRSDLEPGRFGLVKNTLGAESTQEYFAAFRAMRVAAMAEASERIELGFKEPATLSPTDRGAPHRAVTGFRWLYAGQQAVLVAEPRALRQSARCRAGACRHDGQLGVQPG